MMDTACYRCNRVAHNLESFDEAQLSMPTGLSQGVNEFCVISDDAVMSTKEAIRTSQIQSEINQWIQRDDNNYFYCDSCVKLLLETLQAMQTEAQQDNARYLAYQNKLLQNEETEEEIDAEIASLLAQQKENASLIEDLEQGRSLTLKGKIKATEEAKKTKQEKEELWCNTNAHEDKLNKMRQMQFKKEKKLNYYREQIEKLNATSVIEDLFSIDCSSNIGKINNLRLGNLSTQKVENSEIDAACGQVAFLLSVLSSRIPEFKFSSYEICPLGNRSTFIQAEKKYTLYNPESSPIFASFIWTSNFDIGLDILLKCIKELVDWVQKLDQSFRIPYAISPSEISGISIRRGRAGDENWTVAMLRVLDVLRLLTNWVSARY